jgi:uncharacterized membrane protein
VQKGATERRRAGPIASGAAHPVAENVDAISRLEFEAFHGRFARGRVGDAISRATGSVAFAAVHLAWFAAWILTNTGGVPGIEPFDPYPFSFLTLVVSLEAIFLSVFVLMSQNRMTRQADKRAHLDLQIDLLAEQELTAMLQMQRAICRKLDIEVEVADERIGRLTEETDIAKLAARLDEQLPSR